MSNKKTGLGSSLLLKRTTPPEPTLNVNHCSALPPLTEPERSNVSDVSDAPQDQPTVASNQPVNEVLRDRCTIYIDKDVNDRLETAARLERKQRSEVVTEILRQHLPNYRIDRI